MATPEEVLAAASPRTRSCTVCVRGDLRARHGELVTQVMGFATKREAVPADLQDELVAVEAELADNDVEFEVQSIGSAWDLLLVAHPDPTGAGGFDPIAFPEAAAAASVTSPPGWTEQHFHQLRQVVPAAEFSKLWAAVLEVNADTADIPKFGKLFAEAVSSEPNSTTAAPSASPTASSSAE